MAARTAATLPTFAPDELDPSWLDGCDHLFVSGYALMREPVRETRDRARSQLARAAGARVSIDLASWSAIQEIGAEAFRAQLAALAPDVVFANEDEEPSRRRAAARRHVDPQAGRARMLVRRGRAGRAAGRRRRRLDRSRRRARRRVHRRRPRARARGRGPLRGPTRVDAVSATIGALRIASMSQAEAEVIADWRYQRAVCLLRLDEQTRTTSRSCSPPSCVATATSRLTTRAASWSGSSASSSRARSLVVGLGLRPDLTGRGLGLGYLEGGLAFARERYRASPLQVERRRRSTPERSACTSAPDSS